MTETAGLEDSRRLVEITAAVGLDRLSVDTFSQERSDLDERVVIHRLRCVRGVACDTPLDKPYWMIFTIAHGVSSGVLRYDPASSALF